MSLITPENHLVLFAVIVAAAALGIWSEHKKWLGKVSGILVTMILMSILSMTGIVPVASNPKLKIEVYDLIFSYFIPISIPLMLMGSNVMRIIREGGKLLVAFLIGTLGVVLGSFIATYLAAIGASTNLSDMLHVGPAVLGFYLIILFFHLIFLVSLAKIFKLDVYEVIIASAANIMGPSVAAPMAASLGQKKLITPGILVGILGYVIGTFIGVSIAVMLS